MLKLKSFDEIHIRFFLWILSFYMVVFALLEAPHVLEIYWIHGYNIKAHVTQDYFGIFNFIASNCWILLCLFYLSLVAALLLPFTQLTSICAGVILIQHVIFANLSTATSPELKFINYLLLCMTLIRFSSLGKGLTNWTYDKRIHSLYWIVFGVAYSTSAYFKWITPQWIDGSRLYILFAESYYLRPIWIQFSIERLRTTLWFCTYLALLIETSGVFLVFNVWTRLVLFLFSFSMHLLLWIFFDFAQISLGMLVIHVFLFDVRWVECLARVRAQKC